MPAADRLLTFGEFERLPAADGKTELLDGELIQMPPAKRPHNRLAKRLFLALHQLVEALKSAGAARKFEEVEFELGYQIGHQPDSWLIPDVSISHRQQSGGDYFEGSPLVAIEVISASNTAGEIDRKIEKYLTHGAAEVWVVYGETRRVLTYYANHDQVEIGRTHIRSGVLPEVSAIPLAEIW